MRKKSTLIAWAVIILAIAVSMASCGGGGGGGGSSTGTPTSSPTPTAAQTGSWSVAMASPVPSLTKYAGTYGGTFTGGQSGTFDLVACSNGQLLSSSLDSSGDKVVIGVAERINEDGSFNGTLYTGENDQLVTGTFSGNIVDTTSSGSWNLFGQTGTFNCTLKSPNPSFSAFNGCYLGNVTGTSEGNQTIAIGNEGKLIAVSMVTFRTRDGRQITAPAASVTNINADGSISSTLYSPGFTGTFTGNINAGQSGTGMWNLVPDTHPSPTPSLSPTPCPT